MVIQAGGIEWRSQTGRSRDGPVTDFNLKWNADIRQRLHDRDGTSGVDGEYVDSSEGYVTDELDFNRQHFAEKPLGALGTASAKVALPALGTHDFSGPGQAEALGGAFMGLDFVLTGPFLSGHDGSPLMVFTRNAAEI